MSFAALANRVRAEFVEMPGLELTLPQAVRLWNLGLDDCRTIVDSLVDAGVLRWTAKRTIIWAGRYQRVAPASGSYVSVVHTPNGLNPVG